MTDIEPPTEPRDDRLTCDDLDAALRHHIQDLGYRIEEIFPADAPRVAIVSRAGKRIRLERAALPSFETPSRSTQWPIVQKAEAGMWQVGRAGMQYRDLLPDRLGGRVIASHIRIPAGGPVPDYVHYHHVGFQMIYCLRGWVRVVYEDQGPPFVMEAGDCVLQPPQIRHRVLECSPGLEVVEISSPAEHRTVADHDMALPTSTTDPERLFGEQRFVFHQAARADWRCGPGVGFESRDTGIGEASAGATSALVIQSSISGGALECSGAGQFLFNFMLHGSATLRTGTGADYRLEPADSFAVRDGVTAELTPGSEALEMLQVTMARSTARTHQPSAAGAV
jgi:quercetin dioxygenase-like cupin family protein